MNNSKTVKTLAEVVDDIGVSKMLLLTSNERSSWLLSGRANFNITVLENEQSDTEGLSPSSVTSHSTLLRRLQSLQEIADEFEEKGYTILTRSQGRVDDGCLGDSGELVMKSLESIDATSLIDYTPPPETTEAEVQFALWGWNYLLVHGEVYGYYSPTALGDGVDFAHVFMCGINGNESSLPTVSQWESFAGTFADYELRDSVFGSEVTCRCGEVSSLEVGDTNLVQHDNFLPKMFHSISNFQYPNKR